MSRKQDLQVVRDLLKRTMEIAMSDKHVKMRMRFRDNNDLKVVRPPVIIEEIPWQQMNYNHELDCICEDGDLRGIEWGLRSGLFREKYFKCDNYIKPYWEVRKSYSSTGNGFPARKEHTLAQNNTYITSHAFEDVLEDEHSLDNFHLPVITANPEIDKANIAYIEEIVDGIMPVKLIGHMVGFAPWDEISFLRGVEPVLIDIYERPEYLHKIVNCLTEAKLSEVEQMDALGLFDPRSIEVHCTPAAITVPGGNEEGSYRVSDVWYRATAQMFNTVSPEIHDEFEIQYTNKIAEKCAYTYYGCCEPLSDRLDIIKKIKNLRKVGCSPWSDVNRTSEELGGNFVLSKKPNPANVSSVTDPDIIRAEIEETVKACIKNGTPCDITLKDISTVGNRPENLFVWAETVSDVLDEYYGKD